MQKVLRAYHHVVHDSLYKNSIYLMLSTGVMAFFGFFFWIINARLFTSEQIGLATTLISVVTLISSFSILGLNTGIVRYLPTSDQKGAKVNTSMTLIGAASIIFALIYLLGMKTFSPKLLFVRDNPIYALLFVLVILFSSINIIVESTFVALRSTKYVLIKNTVHSIIKIILPLLFIAFGTFGIFVSYGLSLVIAVILSLIFLIAIFKIVLKPQINMTIVKRMMKFSFANYIAGFISILPMNILPVIIINKLGANVSAYYYLDMMIANLLFIIPVASSQSLFAESSYSELEVKHLLKKAITIILLLLIPAIIIISIFGKYILLAFGKQYSAEGFEFLQLITFSGLFVSVNYIGNTILNIKHKINYIILLSLLNAGIVLGLSFLFISQQLKGIGLAWIMGQAVTSFFYLILIKKLAYPHK